MEETLIKRIMPHSLEAEQSVIGSMIMDKDAIMAANEILISEDFYHQQYGLLFQAMVGMDFICLLLCLLLLYSFCFQAY